MPSQLEEILMDVGPCLSSTAAAELRRRYGVTPAAARQRVSRCKSSVRQLDLPFRRGTSFLFLASQYQTPAFFRALGDALEANSGAYARTLQAIGARGGIVPVAHLPSAAGLADASGQLGAQEVLERLVKAGVLAEVEVPGRGGCIGFAAAAELDEPVRRMKARLVAEGVLLEAVKQWARNLALGSFDLFNLRGGATPPTVGRFQWDMTAPSYISGLSVWDSQAKKLKPGFLVADVLLGYGSVDERALRPFLYKCDTLRRMSAGRCMQFFLAESFTTEALMHLRRHGVVPGRVEELFGRDVARALKELISTLTRTAAVAVDAAKFDMLFSCLGRFEGAAGRLRGALFEFVIAALLQEGGWHEVVINKVYRAGGKDLAEVDVRARCGDEVLFVECKGIMPGTVLDDDEVKTWLEKRIPTVAALAHENEEYANCRLKFELWTTGELSANARTMIETKQALVRPTKYILAVCQGPELLQMARRHRRRQPALLEVLQQHFLVSPLSESKLAALGNLVAKPEAEAEVWPDLTQEVTVLTDGSVLTQSASALPVLDSGPRLLR